jgi:hypothetical protein
MPLTGAFTRERERREWLLDDQSARWLRAGRVGREHTVIADVPYRRGEHQEH